MSEVIQRKDIQFVWIKAIQKFMPREITAVISDELIGENRPKPPKPFVTMKLISGPTPVGSDENLRIDNGKFSLASLRQYTISLQGFGQGSFEALALFQTRLYGESLPLFLRKKLDIAIVDRGSIENISELQNVGFEKRSQLDVIFNIASNIEEDISSIETVDISGKINREDGSERTVKKFTVTKT